jgi:outer membrane protein assembly factor BamB
VSGAVEVFVGRPATTDGSLVALAGGNMADGTQRDLAMYQLDESTGAVRWKRPVPDGASAVSPATNGQLAYLSTVGTDTLHTAIDASGTTVFTYAQNTQPQAWTLAPSHFDGTLYFFGGNNGDEVHAANSTTGQRIWTRPRVGLQSSTPTIDSKHVYYLAGGTIQILDRLTGNTVGSIADTSSDGTASPGSHTIALGTQGNLIAHSYRQMRGPRLSSFDIASRSVNWTTTATYNQFYAVADGVIYATRNASSTPAGLDAIDEKTGQVLWTWALPNADQQDRFIGNLVATRDVVFFGSYSSTSEASFVWAIDVRKRESVWRYAEAGHVVISGNRTVYIVSGPGALLSTRVRALRLQ